MYICWLYENFHLSAHFGHPILIPIAASNKARNQQPDIFFEAQPKQQNTT